MAQRYLLLALGGGRRLPGVLLQQLLCGRGLLPPRPCLAQLRESVPTGVTTDRRTVLASVIAACRRLFSQPPKGFEKYFPNGKKPNGTKGSAGETKEAKQAAARQPSGTGSGGGGSGGKKGGKKEDANWWTRLQKGDIPWDVREFRMYVVGSSFFWTMVVYYFFFRVPGREITWKDFVNNYLSKGVVSSRESK